MINPERTRAQISDGLIEYFRAELNDSMLAYDSSLTRMKGSRRGIWRGFLVQQGGFLTALLNYL